ncbi:methionine--tRNA ligase subunit beta [bacterium]|nr:methionine--tRNA ligase subunit beta [bacterium]
MPSDNKFYVTTPIYYVNRKPHIGTSYTTIITDIAARFQRFQGREALVVTGSDEFSQNIADLARAEGKSPREFCDGFVPIFKQLWPDIDIQGVRFVRTSDAEHARLVSTFWQRIYDKGDVYKDVYSGWYHTSDNRFLDEDEVPEDPENHPRLKYLTEDAYFFRLSKYQDWLLEFHEVNPTFVVPDFRRNEMLSRIKQGLRDICISRTSTDYGIRLPWDKGHVFYVWMEALLTYVTGSGFDIDAFEKTFVDGKSSETREPLWETTRADLATQPATNFWPCDLHTMAKDIPWFHAVIWPAMCQSYGLPLPRQELIHGYWNFAGEKMSKSLGNVVDPYDAMKLVGVDGLRYFLVREVPLGLDGNFSHEALIDRYNYDLANDLGNLVHRTVSMLHQLFDGAVPELLAVTEADELIEQVRRETVGQVLEHYQDLRYSEVLQAIWGLIGAANKYIDDKKPWELKKKPERHDEISTVFNRLVNAIRSVLLLVYPVMPRAANQFWQIMNFAGCLEDQRSIALEELAPAGHKVNASQPVFQRLDTKKILAGEESAKAAAPPDQAPAPVTARPVAAEDGAHVITFDDFGRVQLRVAEVLTAEKVENTDKLIRLTLNDGERERQIVAGIALHYEPAELVGKRIVIVANLKPAKLRGILSEGMLLAATDSEGRMGLLTPERGVLPGARVS